MITKTELLAMGSTRTFKEIEFAGKKFRIQNVSEAEASLIRGYAIKSYREDGTPEWDHKEFPNRKAYCLIFTLVDAAGKRLFDSESEIAQINGLPSELVGFLYRESVEHCNLFGDKSDKTESDDPAKN